MSNSVALKWPESEFVGKTSSTKMDDFFGQGCFEDFPNLIHFDKRGRPLGYAEVKMTYLINLSIAYR